LWNVWIYLINLLIFTFMPIRVIKSYKSPMFAKVRGVAWLYEKIKFYCFANFTARYWSYIYGNTFKIIFVE